MSTSHHRPSNSGEAALGSAYTTLLWPLRGLSNPEGVTSGTLAATTAELQALRAGLTTK